jgi:hypothetical protein
MQATMATTSPYGQVLNFSITVRSRVLLGLQLFAYPKNWAIIFLDMPDNPDFYLNHENKVCCRDEKAESLICMELSYAEETCFALLLQQNSDDTNYTRVGFMDAWRVKIFDGMPKRDITIV